MVALGFTLASSSREAKVCRPRQHLGKHDSYCRRAARRPLPWLTEPGMQNPRPRNGGGGSCGRAGALPRTRPGAFTDTALLVLGGLLNSRHWGGLLHTFDHQLAHLLSRFVAR